MSDEVTQDTLLGGRVRLLQPRRGHRAGTDAVLLAGLADVRPGDHVVDLGSASGAVGLMIAARHPSATVMLVDRQPDLVELARENARLNEVDGRVGALAADVFAAASWPPGLAGSADLVVTNPPFFEAGARTSADPGRRSARVMEGGDLRGWLSAADRLLKPGGRVCIIHRADGLEGCLAALDAAFGSRGIVPIHAKAETAATRILVTAVKGGKAPTTLRPALVLHGPDRRFTPEAERLHRPAPANSDLRPPE